MLPEVESEAELAEPDSAFAERTRDAIIDENVEHHPWIEALTNTNSTASRMVKSTSGCFNKFQQALLHTLSKLYGKDQ